MKFLDLDAVAVEEEFTIKLNGKTHKLHFATVETFIANMKDFEKLGLNASTAEELDITMTILKRAFPTVTEEEMRNLTIHQMQAINDFARTANGEKTNITEASSEGNGLAAS
jgi:hypothetical protein